MEIQFSFQAAQDACDNLFQNVTDIEKKRAGIQQENEDMAKIWTGDFSESLLGQMKLYADWIEDVNAYVTKIKEHINTCRNNYEITEKMNKKVLKGIDELFM